MAHIPYDAVLFDLDGVLTSTSALHAACWKRTFEETLGEPFDAGRDYLAHVDGKPRDEGVRDFMRSRGVDPAPDLVRAIGSRKQALVERALARRPRGAVSRLDPVGRAPAPRGRADRGRVIERELPRRAPRRGHRRPVRADGRRHRRRNGSGSAASRRPTGSSRRRRGWASRRAARSSSRTRSQEWPRAVPASSGSSSASPVERSPRTCERPVPTSSSTTSGSWRREGPRRARAALAAAHR